MFPIPRWLLFSTRPKRQVFFRLLLCVELWSHRNFSLASTITAACAKHANNYGSTHSLYPPSPQLQCWKLKWKRWQELITNMSNQSTPYCNIEEWGHGGWRINLMSRFLCMVVQLFIPPTILLPAQFPYSNTSVLCVVLFGTHANTICVHPIACTIIITSKDLMLIVMPKDHMLTVMPTFTNIKRFLPRCANQSKYQN